jgi:glycosyltransferase involved in cell wall biosynthesis
LKILLACSQYPPMKTGYAMVAGRLSEWFARYGHDVDVITEGRGCYRIGKVAFLDETGRRMFNHDYEIVQVVGPTPFFSEQCVKSAKRKGLPVAYEMNAFPGLSSYYHNPMSGFVDSMYKKLNLYPRIRDVDLLIFHTNDFARYFTRFYDGPFKIIPCGIDSQDLDPHPEENKASKDRILFVGQLRRYKGLPYLLAAVKLLRDSGRDIVLDIVGEGPDRNRVLDMVSKMNLQNAITIRGDEVSRRELDLIYRNSGLFVLPSVGGESFGIVLLEAAARGVPIVASDLPGVREVVEYLGGTLVPPGNSSALASAITKSFDTSRARPHRTPRADMTRFLWARIAERHLDCYRDLLGLPPEQASVVQKEREVPEKLKVGAES